MEAQTVQTAQATNQFWMWFIGLLILMFQGANALQLFWFRTKFKDFEAEMKELWGRSNHHDHEIECNQADCKPKTTGVIIRSLAIIALTLVFIRPCLSADFDKVWQNTILPHEGGYSNNIHDPGNWTGGREGKGRFLGTKYGIAASVYGTSLLKQGIIIKHLTKEQAKQIFKKDYWDALYLGDLKSQGIADELCDEAVNTGKGQTEKLIGRVFAEIEWATKEKIPVPPKFIPQTIEWINAYTKDRDNRISFYNSIRMKRVKFYVSLVRQKPKLKQFFFAWVDRSVD